MNISTNGENKSSSENKDANYNPTARDFQKTSEDTGKESESADTSKDVSADDNYNHSDRDFQRTENESDNVSASENDHEDENKRTEEANTQPTKETF